MRFLKIISAGLLILSMSGGNSINTSASTVLGDLNGDGILSAIDSTVMARFLMGNVQTTNLAQYDINGNGIISNADLNKLYQMIMSNDF